MRKILSTLFFVACVSLLHAATVDPVEPTAFSGNENLTWAYNDHVLTISVVDPAAENCAMPDFSANDRAPWYNYDGNTNLRNAIQSVVFNGNITHIGSLAFNACKGLLSVTIPASVITMGSQTFAQCDNLASVTVEGATIGVSAFAKCKNLTSVIMPNVTTIERGAFSECTALTSFEIPSGVTAISNDLFNGCTNLETVTLPNCTSFGVRVFKGCSSLRRIIYNYQGNTLVKPCSVDIDDENYSLLGVPTGGMLFIPGNEDAQLAFSAEPRWTEKFSISSLAYEYDFNEEGNTIPEDKTATMTALKDDGAIVDIKFTGRSFLRDGCYNTLCLPFNLSAEQLADEANPLYNFSIYEVTSLAYVGSLIKLEINKVSAIEAGEPYLVKYNADSDAEPLAPLANPEFTYVKVTADAGSNNAVEGVTMKGILKPTTIDVSQNTMFLLAGNKLAWVENESAATMKGFRAYFVFDTPIAHAAPLRSMSACIVEKKETPTDIEIVENDDMQATKVIENGTIYIIKNGVKYNVQGQVISK